ncbi:MAG: hypothetical protein ACP5K5_02245, partial [Candidatus Micrarchaeia archaeon]
VTNSLIGYGEQNKPMAYALKPLLRTVPVMGAIIDNSSIKTLFINDGILLFGTLSVIIALYSIFLLLEQREKNVLENDKAYSLMRLSENIEKTHQRCMLRI